MATVLAAGKCTVYMWNFYVHITISVMNLCPGDLASMRQAEVTALNKYMRDGSAEGGDGEAEADSELGEPPEKKRCLEKENVMTSSAVKRRGRPRKPLKEVQVRSLK